MSDLDIDLGPGLPCAPGDSTHQTIRDEGGWPFCDRPEGPWGEPGGTVAADCPKCLIALRMIIVSHPDATFTVSGNGAPVQHGRCADFLAWVEETG